MAGKKRISGKGCRAKGTKAETELVDIFDKAGIPSQRVLGSGSFVGAKADLKLGIELEKDGSKPSPDESRGKLRAEVKNRANNPEYLFDTDKQNTIASVNLLTKKAPEFIFNYLTQDAVSKLVVLRRSRIKQGDLKSQNYNDTHVVVMGLGDFIDFFKEAFPDVVVEFNGTEK